MSARMLELSIWVKFVILRVTRAVQTSRNHRQKSPRAAARVSNTGGAKSKREPDG